MNMIMCGFNGRALQCAVGTLGEDVSFITEVSNEVV
jgi:hypothetical protein